MPTDPPSKTNMLMLMHCDLRENRKCKLCLQHNSVPRQLWKLVSLLVRDEISGHLVGLCSVASVDSSLAGLSPPQLYPPTVHSAVFGGLKTASAVFEWQRQGRGAPPSSFSHILFEGANMGPSLQATGLSVPRGTQ